LGRGDDGSGIVLVLPAPILPDCYLDTRSQSGTNGKRRWGGTEVVFSCGGHSPDLWSGLGHYQDF